MSHSTISVIMPIHNQEDLIFSTMRGIIYNMSQAVKEVILIIDGCTDNTEDRLFSMLEEFPFPPKILYEPNIFEVLCTNVGFKTSTCDYSLFIQDDMVMSERHFDQRLLKPCIQLPNVLCVTARDAVDIIPHPSEPYMLEFINVAGRDVNTPRDIFAVRDGVNRGPILYDNSKAEQLGYMDVRHAPQNLDDIDICIRGWLDYGWLSGAYACEYVSELAWGSSRKNIESYSIFEVSNRKNHRMMRERYKDYMSDKKHDMDFPLP